MLFPSHPPCVRYLKAKFSPPYLYIGCHSDDGSESLVEYLPSRVSPFYTYYWHNALLRKPYIHFHSAPSHPPTACSEQSPHHDS